MLIPLPALSTLPSAQAAPLQLTLSSPLLSTHPTQTVQSLEAPVP